MKAAGRAAGAHQIERLSIPESIRDSVRERILSGEFAEGEALIQDALAEEYGVSRMPIREALRQLEAVGLVVMRTHKGAVVTTVPTEQVEELFELRALLEVDLITRSVPRMTDQDVAEAGQILDRLENSFRARDMASWGRLNWEFHRRLYLPSHRPQTLSLVQGVNLQTERFIRVHLIATDGIAAAEQEHREMLRLCALRETDAVASFLRGHILEAGRALVASLRRQRSERQLAE